MCRSRRRPAFSSLNESFRLLFRRPCTSGDDCPEIRYITTRVITRRTAIVPTARRDAIPVCGIYTCIRGRVGPQMPNNDGDDDNSDHRIYVAAAESINRVTLSRTRETPVVIVVDSSPTLVVYGLSEFERKGERKQYEDDQADTR